MKYAVLSNSNGTFRLESEWNNDIKGARIDFRNKCNTYDNAPDVNRAVVILVNENYDQVGEYKEIIDHTPEPEPNEQA